MFLVRRRSDGQYWRNLSTGRTFTAVYGKVKQSLWTDSIKGIKPFAPSAAAKNSRLSGSTYPAWPTYQGWSREKINKYRREKWDELYELIPVSVKVEIKE